MALNPAIPRLKDRRLYLVAACFIPIIVLAGFARTYYLKGLFGTPLPSILVHVHGAVMTAWVVLFVTQVWLVAARRTRVHQRLGILGSILAGLIVVVGLATAVFSAARESLKSDDALRFLTVPFFDMFVFTILITIALYFRRRPEIHKRLMLLAALSLLPAAVTRIPIQFIDMQRPLWFFGLTDMCIIVCLAYDTFKHRRVHPMFAMGAVLIILSHPLRLLLAGTDAWMRFATALVNLVR